MKLVLFLAMVAAASANILQFNTMTSCTVGISYTQAVSDYLGYGCYCGFGGKGTPKDDTDKCCDSHDACYREALNHGCGMADRYLITYDYTSNKAADGTCQLTCKLQADYPADDVEAECKAFMCECDSTGSQCFAANRPTFDDKYKDFPQLFCW